MEENYRGDGLALRALGYGMEGYRVDGNDVLAIFNATKKAREQVMKDGEPVLIEAMTYRYAIIFIPASPPPPPPSLLFSVDRLGSHSTSDDQTGYQDMSEVERWRESYFPLDRLRGYLVNHGLWDQEKEQALVSSIDGRIKAAMKRFSIILYVLM